MFRAILETPKPGQAEKLRAAVMSKDYSAIEYDEVVFKDGFESLEDADAWIESIFSKHGRQLVCEYDGGLVDCGSHGNPTE